MRLIDADELIKTIKANHYQLKSHLNSTDYGMFTIGIQYAINEQTTFDAVPVVRCKDCEFWQDNNGGYPHEDCRWEKDETPDENDFCSYGEKREEKQ